MEAFFGLARVFEGHPERAYLVALVFLALAWLDRYLVRFDPAIRTWAMYVPAAAWLLYAINEYHSGGDGPSPRFDLYLTWPVMVALTLVFLGVWIANVRGILRKRRAGRG